MKKIFWIICASIFLFNSCRDDVNTTTVTVIQPEPEVNVISDVRGVVFDSDQNPVSAALVSVRTETTFTNTKGEYSFSGIVANRGKEQIVVSKNGYFIQAAKIYNESETPSYHQITLLAKDQGETINASESSSLSMDNGASILFPANSLMDSNGSIYNGEAKIYSKFLDPNSANFSREMMSELVGFDSDQNKKALAPIAMLFLEIESLSGESLSIISDAGVEITFSANGSNEILPSWVYDLEEEFWLQDVDCYPASGNYTCSINSTGSWSCCKPIKGAEISLEVFNNDNTPASFVKVEFEDNNSYFHFGSYTNQNGTVQGLLPINTDGFNLSVEDLCANIVYLETNAYPYALDSQIPDILLDVTVEQFSINIEGSIEDCNNLPISDGWINVRYPDYEKNFGVNPDGSFDFNVFFNCVDFPDMEIRGYDMNGEQVTNPIFHDQLSDVQTGIISTCETLESSLEITGNGTMSTIFPIVYDQVWSEPTDIYIESELPGGTFYARVDNYDGLSSTYIAEVTITNESGISPDLSGLQGSGQNLNVTITSDDGTFLEGNISGNIDDGAGNFNIDVNFIARKKL